MTLSPVRTKLYTLRQQLIQRSRPHGFLCSIPFISSNFDVQQATSAGLPTPPSFLVIASILVGLPITLWAYKVLVSTLIGTLSPLTPGICKSQCAMMILFQRKIIYMGYAPLGARTQQLVDVPRTELLGLSCNEIHIPSLTRTKPPRSTSLFAPATPSISALIIRSALSPHIATSSKTGHEPEPDDPRLLILYLQGNAGNPLHRLPVFQALLASIQRPYSSSSKTMILAPAPRSYWTSPGRPSQIGILADYRSSLEYALRRFPNAKIVLYGHSLGGAAAICLLANSELSKISGSDRVRGVILENPFSSVPGMLRALYPQRWLPYQYLSPFVWDTWDALEDLSSLPHNQSIHKENNVLERLRSRMLVLTSELDEVVPPQMGVDLVKAATLVDRHGDYSTSKHQPLESPELCTRLVSVRGALHEDAWSKMEWAGAVGPYLRSIITEANGISTR